MDSIFRHRARIFPLILFSILLVFLAITSAYALIIPPDPFESTDRFALLSQAPDGSITLVQARVKAPGPDPLGAGKLWALLQYKLPPSTGPGKFYSAASKPVSVQGLSNTSTLIEFDFSNEPIPLEAYNRTLFIHYQESPESPPILLAEYRPEQLLLSPAQDAYQPPPSGASLLFGPVTFLREREAPKTEEVSFVISDTTGPFLLRLTNGDSDGGQRVSSALVKLNGSEVFRPSQFNQNVATLSRQVVCCQEKIPLR